MKQERRFFGVSRTVFMLGMVSFLTDISSEMLIPVVPQFLKFIIGASTFNIGLIEGIAESTASLLRVWAGYLADKTGRPKLLTVIGYGLSAVTKPFYLGATSWSHVLGIRFADRFGKGIRSAPRDVLIADASEESERGRAFGLHRAMDTLGATLGPIIVIFIVACVAGCPISEDLFKTAAGPYKLIFIAASVPAILGWLILITAVKEKHHDPSTSAKPQFRISALDRRYKLFLGIVTLFAIGNSSDAFLVLRARSAPVNMGFIEFLVLYVVFNAISSIVALRSGIMSDKVGRKPIIAAGWMIFSVVYFAMARIASAQAMWVWFCVYGVYYGMTEGLLRAYAVDLAPAELRGTAVGAYYTFTGLALLPASLIAGLLWDKIGPSAPFYYGSATSALAALLLVTLGRRK